MLPSRRAALATGLAAAAPALTPPAAPARPTKRAPTTPTPRPPCSVDTLPFTGPGPYATARLPPLEHVCASLSPACVGKQCAVSLELVVPRRAGGDAGCPPPHPAPLAVLSGGFLVGRAAYMASADRLASWGFAVATYDKTETALDPLDDVVSADVIRELMDYAAASRALRPVVDASRPYLLGHSRGGKLSVLAAARDAAAGVARVAALGLLDPVNNTRYAPQGPRYPSASAALRSGGVLARGPPLLAVGAGGAADCAPPDANYATFFDAAPGAAWEVVVDGAGHFQVLDSATALQRAVCAAGPLPDAAVRDAAVAPLVAWGRAVVFGDGGGDVGGLLSRCENDVAALLSTAADAAGLGAAARAPPSRARRKRVPADAKALAAWAD